jgi:hypothetical protein
MICSPGWTARLRRAVRRWDVPLLLEAYAVLLAVDLGVRFLGLLPVWRLIRARFRPPGRRGPPEEGTVVGLQQLLRCAGRNHLYPMKCLPQALALAWLLGRRGVAAELRFGARKHHDALQAHAWLCCSGKALNPWDNAWEPFQGLGDPTFTTGRLQDRSGEPER